MKTPPMSLRAAARRLKVDRSVLARLVQGRGVEPAGQKNGHSTYNLADLQAALDAPVPLEDMTEFQRRDFFRSELLRMQLERKCADLCRREDVEREMARLLGLIRATLKGLPARLAADPEFAGWFVEDGPEGHVGKRMHELLDQYLRELQRIEDERRSPGRPQ